MPNHVPSIALEHRGIIVLHVFCVSPHLSIDSYIRGFCTG